MSDTSGFSFGNDAVAGFHDSLFAPMILTPASLRLAYEHDPCGRRPVQDRATGTETIPQPLDDRYSDTGKGVGADINAEMLNRAKRRCEDARSILEFVECPAKRLDVADNSVDLVVCQRGFHFFVDRPAATREIYRVLNDGGSLIATTWGCAADCELFEAIYDALVEIDHPEIADLLRAPFGILQAKELIADLRGAGFADVHFERRYQDLVISRGANDAVGIAYSTSIGPKLQLLSDEQQTRFQSSLLGRRNMLSDGGTTTGRIVTNVFVARKASPLPLFA